MAKNRTEIQVTTVFDGELDATDVFVGLIAQKHGMKNHRKIKQEYLAIPKQMEYNEDGVQKNCVPSGLCG